MNEKDKMDSMLDRILAFKPASEVKQKKDEKTQHKVGKKNAEQKSASSAKL